MEDNLEKSPDLTLAEALEKKEPLFEFDFEKILDPYRESGQPGSQKEPRTWGRIITWLTGKHKFDLETVGAAILTICLEVRQGKVFKGDGTQGSAGREFVHRIRTLCMLIHKKRVEDAVFTIMGEKMYQHLQPLIARDIKRLTVPWYRRLIGKDQ